MTIDVIGVILEIESIQQVQARSSGNYMDKRTILIGDEDASIKVTLWKEVCEREFETG